VTAGDLRERFKIQRNVAAGDWSGHPAEADWQDRFEIWGGIKFLRGSEAVIAARLTARQPAVLRIRTSSQARSILPSDRAVNARTGEIFNIRELPRTARDNRGFLEMLVEAGAN